MAVSELVLVRHGESMGNAAAAAAHAAAAEVIEVGQRDADVPLSPRRRRAGAGPRRRASGACSRTSARRWSGPRPTSAPSRPRRSPSRRRASRCRSRSTSGFGTASWASWTCSPPRAWRAGIRSRPSGDDGSASSTTGRRAASPGPMSRCASAVSVTTWSWCPTGPVPWLVCHDALVLIIRYVCERLTEAELLAIGAATPVLNVSLTQLVRDPARRLAARSGSTTCPIWRRPSTGHPARR